MIFDGDSLAFAIRRRSMKKKDLAESLGVTTRQLSNYLNNERQPSLSVLRQMSTVLNFPITFFSGEDDWWRDAPRGINFRKASAMTKAQEDSAKAMSKYAEGFLELVEKQYEFPALDIPSVSVNESSGLTPEDAADLVRAEWGITGMKLENLIAFLEMKGVRIFSLDERNNNIDAYSMWRDSAPFVFLNTQKTVERTRFDLAHELGHLVMHQGVKATSPEQEAEADRFASAFLMPASSIKAHLSSDMLLDDLISAKSHWGVSLAALVYRMNRLGFFSEWMHRTLCIRIAQEGFRKHEPNRLPDSYERSTVLTRVLEDLCLNGASIASIAKKMNVYENEIKQLLLFSPVKNQRTLLKRGHLKLVS